MSYILIENVIFPVMSNGFKKTERKDMWSSHPTYNIKVFVDNSKYDNLKSIFKSNLHKLEYNGAWFKVKDGEIKYSIKLDKFQNNSTSGYYSGQLDIINMQELSKSKKGRIIQIEVGNLEMNEASIELSRDMALMELLS